MENETFKFSLPFFPGCYDTLLTLDYDGQTTREEAEYILLDLNDLPSDIGELNPLFGDVVEYDYEGWHKALMEHYEKATRELMEERGLDGTALKITGFWSPREYNFETDELLTAWSPSEEDWKKVLEEVRAHREEFQKYVKEKWSSRSGFISFMPDEAEDYLDNPIEEYDMAGPMAGQLLYYFLDEKWLPDKDFENGGGYGERPCREIELDAYEDEALWQPQYLDFRGLPEAIKNHSAEILKWLADGQKHDEAEALYEKILAESRKGDGGDDAPVMSTEFHYGATASNTFEVTLKQ